MADLDVVLFGPTGVTGREVAKYLASRAPELGLSWGVAGRDPERIAASLAGLASQPKEVLHADSANPSSIESMVGCATVVANLVGPYARHGADVYRACAERGVHEIDLTGETDFVKDMIDAWDDLATETGAKIVPTAGFEALPFDLAALLAAHTLHQRTGDPVVEVDIAVGMSSGAPMSSMTDAVSGGTYVSGVEAFRRGLGAEFVDPHLLDPPTSSARSRYDLRPRKHAMTGKWLAPLFPSPFLIPAVVHRSAALLRDSEDTIFAPDFNYREGTVTEDTVPAWAAPTAAVVLSLLSVGMGASGKLPPSVREPLADWMLRAGPKQGDGPRPEDLDAWSYRLDVRATDARGAHQDVIVEADGHPGYKSTATMVAEAALALADRAAGLPDGAGFLTPATALGLPVIDRLASAGARFAVVP